MRACLVWLGLWASVAASVSACEKRETEAPALVSAHQPIINGTADPTESGTVWVTHVDYPFLCSGTLIASTLVTTAKHCAILERAGAADEPLAGDRFRVGFGAQSGALTFRSSSRMEWIGMPGNTEVAPAVDSGEDIALIWLSSAAPPTAKIHAVKLDYVPSTGDKITIVGYGRSSLGSNASGVKLSTVDSVSGFSPSTGIIQTTGKGACSGDSGGSFFFGAARELVGVTSTAGGSSPTSFCDVGITNATSVRNPRVNQLLSTALGIVGVCSPQPELCGDALDQDCDGIADNSCKKDGQACTRDVDCETGVCRDLGAGKVCARACDERVRCPAGQRCVASCTAGWCEPGAQGTKALLEPCASSSECTTNHCSTAGCTFVCNPTLGQCPDDMACRLGQGCGECLPLGSVPAPRNLGEACAATRDCALGGECLDDGFGVKHCATPCLEGNACPPGLACRGGRCVRTGGFSLGERCLSPEDCSSYLCATFPDTSRNYCTRTCSQSSDCGSGFDCLDAFGGRVCVPYGSPLGKPCQADSQCTSGRCQSALGLCTRACDPKLVPCPAGFRCEIESGVLICVPGPNAYPEPKEPEPEAGSADSGGPDAGPAASGGSAGSAPEPGGREGGVLSNDAPSESGCSCRMPAPSRSPGGIPWGVLAALLLGRGLQSCYDSAPERRSRTRNHDRAEQRAASDIRRD